LKWIILDLPEYPTIRVLERRMPDRLVLLAWCSESGRKLGYEEFPGVKYNVYLTLKEVWRCRMKFIKDSLAKGKMADVPAACGDATLSKKYPALFEFLTCNRDDEGRERKTATLSIFYHDGQFKCFLNDRQEECSTCVTATTLNGLWEALESRITSSEPGWRALRQQGGGKGHRGQTKKT